MGIWTQDPTFKHLEGLGCEREKVLHVDVICLHSYVSITIVNHEILIFIEKM